MSPRRRKNIFQTRDQRFNYRFGSPSMRKRYRVRSKRRLITAICVLLVLLLLAGLAVYYFFFVKDAKEPPAPSAGNATEQTEQKDYEAISPKAKEIVGSELNKEDANNGALLKEAHDTTAKVFNKRRSSWKLLLVNQWHAIPDDFTVDTITLLNGLEIDARAADDLDAMIDDCFAAGCYPDIASAYRSHDYQQILFDEEKNNWINEGYSEEEAEKKAAESIATPGTSEHECGLAVDIVDAEYQVTDKEQENTPTQKWLLEHCWEYGFILRYPADKTTITGKIYEPWHYRYVGKKYAKDIHEKGVCLEEYVWQVDKTDAEASAAD